MLFSHLAKYFSKLEQTSSRIEKITLLANLLKESGDSIQQIIYLSEGRVVPFFEDTEFNVGNAIVQKAIAAAFDVEVNTVIESFSRLGDLGDVANSLFEEKKIKTGNVSVEKVFETLSEVAHSTGKNSTQKKLDLITTLLKEVDGESARYIVRMILGKLRLGFSDRSILDGLALAFTGDKKNRGAIEKAYYKCSDLGRIANLIAQKGASSLDQISLIPSVPLFPKLVERSSSVQEVFKRIPRPLFQPKYDGLRVQIHLFKDESGQRKVKMFSRRLENLTEMFPDIERVVLQMDVESVVIDSEVIGFNASANEFFSFQETSQRRRKYNVDELSNRIPVVSFAFDLLYLNGKDVTDEPLSARLEKLATLLEHSRQDIIKMSDSTMMESLEQGEKYFMTCVEEGLEGIIAKDITTRYSPGTRNFEWIKLKRASVSELNDTIDCVILGYYYGYGQRAKFGIGALLVGVYEPEADEFQTIAKIGSGMSDEQLIRLKKDLDELAIKSPLSNVSIDKKLFPDVYTDPKLVVVVRADEITRSSVHTAGRNKEGIGYALRFPRLIEIRSDKRPEDITTVEEIGHIVKKPIERPLLEEKN